MEHQVVVATHALDGHIGQNEQQMLPPRTDLLLTYQVMMTCQNAIKQKHVLL